MPTDPPALGIERFDTARHDRAAFDCGVGRLNNYLRFSARKQQKDDMTRVYAVVVEGSARILGYHAINLGMMNVDEMKRRPRGAPDHGEIPVLFLGQVAVDKTAQGRGLGGILMHHVFEKACAVSDMAGCHAILLDAIADSVAAQPVIPAECARLEIRNLVVWPEIRHTLALAQKYAQEGYDSEAYFTRVAELACQDDVSEMHGYKFQQAVYEEYHSVGEPYRWVHLVAAIRHVAFFSGVQPKGIYGRVVRALAA